MKISDLEEIKLEILNCGYIPKILEELGCSNIQKRNNRFEAKLPDKFNSSNTRSVQVYDNEGLTSAVRSRGIKGDIYTLVAYLETGNSSIDYLNKQLHKAKKKILQICGWSNSSFQNEDGVIHNGWLKELKEKRSQEFDLSKVEPNPVLPESILNEFVRCGHEKWVEDNINPFTQEEFEICFDLQSERIAIPIRNSKGQLIGVKGRATRKEDKKDYKYLPIYSFYKSRELYNLHKALPFILDKNEIILWESEKSCLKSWQFNVKNTVSQMGSSITKIQAEIIKRLSPDIKIILGYDKGILASEIKLMAQVFGNYDNIYGIYDTKDLLQDKQSPADAPYEVFIELLNNHCYKIPIK